MNIHCIKFWLPLLLLLIFTPFSAKLDLCVARYFYSPEQGFSTQPIAQWIYLYAIYPGWILLSVGVVMVLISVLSIKQQKYRRYGVYLVMTFVVGAGVITHLMLKDCWGRPRPKQTIEFGGSQEFRPYYQPNFFSQPEPSKSFPCGHCTMGFYFFSLAIVGNHMKKRYLTLIGYTLAAVLGLALSYARIAQGGHFISDTFVTALVMWYTALIFEWILLRKHK